MADADRRAPRDESATTWTESWADAAYSLFESDAPLSLSLNLDHSGKDLPDVHLDDLCEAIFANINGDVQ